jgi:cobalt/nickel transport system permease protein
LPPQRPPQSARALGVAVPAMAGTHAIIGVGEAMVAAAVLTAVVTARPDIVPQWARLQGAPGRAAKVRAGVWIPAGAGLVLAAALALLGSPFASKAPDGLEKVAEQKGFMQAASEDKVAWTKAPFPDYRIRAVGSGKVSTSLAGLIGTVAVFGVGFVAIKSVVRPQTGRKDPRAR